jgi:hypothetical protein
LIGLLVTPIVTAPVLWAALAPSPAVEMAAAAQRFLQGLSPELRRQAQLALDDGRRVEWYYTPTARPGVSLKQMNARQRELAHALLKTGLSATGYERTTTIMSLEKVLAEMEDDPVNRDPELYSFTIFGRPDPTGTWGWKVEGHHLSVPFTIVGGTLIATAPNFFGSNPAEVRQGPRRGLRVLGASEDLGRQLVTSLTDGQRRQAIFNVVAPHDIVTGNAARVDPLAPLGLPAAQMDPAQRATLEKILTEFSSHLPEVLAQQRLDRIRRASVDKIRFGWAGSTEIGRPHYYRLQGPTFIIELDNTQNDANHVHQVFRDFADDFGRDLLREHYAKTAH